MVRIASGDILYLFQVFPLVLLLLFFFKIVSYSLFGFLGFVCWSRHSLILFLIFPLGYNRVGNPLAFETLFHIEMKTIQFYLVYLKQDFVSNQIHIESCTYVVSRFEPLFVNASLLYRIALQNYQHVVSWPTAQHDKNNDNLKRMVETMLSWSRCMVASVWMLMYLQRFD